jgi:hypothetical protein
VQGINPDDAQQMLGQVAETAHAHVEEQSSGLLGDNAGKSFFAAFAAGLVHGDGFLGSSYFPCIFWRYAPESFWLSRTYVCTVGSRFISPRNLAAGGSAVCYRNFCKESTMTPY